MLGFTASLKEERAGINEALSRVVGRLPASVQEIAAYSLLSGGKRLRPMLLLTTARVFGCRRPDLHDASASVELFHVASLLHDDVLDEAETRRGQTSAHLRFGVRPCLLAGDALLAEGCRILAAYDDPRMVHVISEALIRTAAGEIEEIARAGRIFFDMSGYLSIIEGKTAWILRASCEIGALLAGASPEEVEKMAQYGLNLGLAFQIVDDALDFADEAATGKPTGGDLREGKCTPPILFYAQSLSAPEREIFERKFAQSSFTEAEIASIVRAVREGGFVGRCRDLADSYLDAAAQNLSGLPGGRNTFVLKEALNFVRNRAS